MITALFIWLLHKAGIEATPEMFARYEREFRERGHHVTLDFGSTRFNGTRWKSDDFEKLFTIGLGYEYLVARRYNGVGLEVQGQVMGPVFKPNSDRHEYFVGAGLAYYPIPHLRIFMHTGPNILDTGKVGTLGRVGVGWRIPFFAIAIQPMFYYQTSTLNGKSWSLAARFEY